jgi:PAS domain S-box-containing protein
VTAKDGDQPRQVSPSSDELLRLVVESTTGFAIVSTDPRGLVTSWNVGAERLLGYAEDEIFGRSVDVIFVPEDRMVGAPDAERATAVAAGKAPDERWHLRKDGSRFWASGLLMPLADGNGFVKIIRDLTDRRKAQERLEASEALFRLLATSIPQLVFRTKGNGERTWPSPQWIAFTGMPFDDNLGLGWLDAVHPDDRRTTMEAWNTARETGEYYAEHRIRRSTDGVFRWHQTQARPAADEGDDAANWVGTSSDDLASDLAF